MCYNCKEVLNMKNLKDIRNNQLSDKDITVIKRYKKHFAQNRFSHGHKKDLVVTSLRVQKRKKNEPVVNTEFEQIFNNVTKKYDDVFKKLVDR